MDKLVLIAYAAAIAFLGWRAVGRRKAGSEDYILASRTLTLPGFVATLVPSFFGGTLGVGEYAYRYGASNWITQGLPYYIFSLLYALFLAKRIRSAPGMTAPDHLEKAYGRSAAALAGLLLFILAAPADDVLMLGLLARVLTGWPMILCLLAVTAVSVGFLFTGGLRADVSANRLEFLLMFGGFAVILPFAHGSGARLSSLPAAHLSLTGGQGPLYVLSWFFIALWTFVDPTFHQRVCAAQDARTARVGIIVSVLFWFCFDAMTTTAGLYARALLPNLKDPLMAYPALAERLLSPAVKGLFFAGLASSTFAALGTRNFVAAVSIARDAVGRIWDVSDGFQESWIRRGLLATSLLSIALALALPSVVGLWFTIGSTVIPGLLIPLLSCYFEPLRMPRGAVLPCMLGGWLGSTAAWAWGSPVPFYPGLAISASVWALGRLWTQLGRASRGPA